MKRVLAVCAVLAIISIGSLTLAADGEAPVVKGNVEVYGQAKMSVDMIDTDSKTTGADKELFKVSSNSSRLGIKGKEELSEGLSAVFQIELGINFDGSQTKAVSSISSATTNTTTGVTTITTKDENIDKITYRNTFAGLSNKTLGTLIFGIHDTPYKLSTGKLDVFGDSMADYNAIIGNVNGTTNFDLRTKDSIMYTSPVWAGLQVMAATSTTGTESSNGATPDPSSYSASLTYNNGPVFVTLAHEIHKNGFTSWDANDTITGSKIGAGFTFGSSRLGFVYEKLDDDKANTKFSRDAFYISASRKIGNETLKLAYGIADDGEDLASETGATQVSFGIDHAFSKRTSVYALYSMMDNDKNATYGLGQGGAGGSYTPAAGESPSVISIGLNHSF